MIFLANNCNSYLYSQQKQNIYQIIVRAFIQDRNSQVKIDPQKNILIIGADNSERFENGYWLDISFVNPKLLFDFKYTKVYNIDGYKLIIDESLSKSSILESSFMETKYENFNLATQQIDYDSKNWLITFNWKNEIIHISPQRRSKEIKDLLLKKGIKFSKDYID